MEAKIKPKKDHVPRCGHTAHFSGWAPKDCPWEDTAPEAREWLAAWHVASAISFRTHVESRECTPREKLLELLVMHPGARVRLEGFRCEPGWDLDDVNYYNNDVQLRFDGL